MAREVPFWLVWRQGGESPQRMHPSQSGAEQEAERLAREHKGQSFYVLQPLVRFATSDIVREVFDTDQIPF